MVPHLREGHQDQLTLATSCLLRKINIENASVSDRRQFLQLIIKRINTLINTVKFA